MEPPPHLVQAASEISHGQGLWEQTGAVRETRGLGGVGGKAWVGFLPPFCWAPEFVAWADHLNFWGAVPSCFLFYLGGGGRATGLGRSCPPLISCGACPQFPLKEGLLDEKSKEEEMEVEDSSFKLCVPGIVTLQSPLLKTFRSTDTVGKCSGQPALRPKGFPWLRLMGVIPVLTTRWDQRT